MESWADFDFGWIFGWLDFEWIWLGFGWIRVDFASLWLISLFILLRFSMISPRFELRFHKETKVLGRPRKP